MDKVIMDVNWKFVDGYNHKYRVSNTGIVERYSHVKNKWIPLKQGKHKDGYPVVSLYGEDKKHKRTTVHRLVASAFIPNTENKETVNHINGIKTDNRVCNLEWSSFVENIAHMYENKLRKSVKGEDWCRSVLKNDDVRVIKILINKGIRNKYLAELYGVTSTCISDIKSGKTWSWLRV